MCFFTVCMRSLRDPKAHRQPWTSSPAAHCVVASTNGCHWQPVRSANWHFPNVVSIFVVFAVSD